MLSFWLQNNETKTVSADGLLTLLIFLAVSLDVKNKIVTTAADLSTTLMYPTNNVSICSFICFFIVKNIFLASMLILHDNSVLNGGTSESPQITQASGN